MVSVPLKFCGSLNQTKIMTPNAPPQKLPHHMRQLIDLIIFDLDGVILSEGGYWDTARLTMWEILQQPNHLGCQDYFGSEMASTITKSKLRENIAPDSLFNELKRRAINSNWDKTYVLTSLHLTGILYRNIHPSYNGRSILPFLQDSCATTERKLHDIGSVLRAYDYNSSIGMETINQFLADADSLTGARILEYVQSFISQQLGGDLRFFAPKGEFWQFCYQIFQRIYNADPSSPGLFRIEEEPVLDRQKMAATLRTLNERYKLGIATGRPLEEVIGPLNTLELLSYFDESRIITYDHVVDAEKLFAQEENPILLGKPHPFVVLKAIYPDKDIHALLLPGYASIDHGSVVVVGDAASDIIAAKKANCISIGVLTGIENTPAGRQDKFREFSDLDCDVIIESVLELPHVLGLETCES
jgi:phosphoglycolate phosphatase-like HAD superfamily hydrolase